MRWYSRHVFLSILTVAGFLIYFLHYPFWSPVLFVPFIGFMVSLLSKKRRERGAYRNFYPFISGLLIVGLKVFYWDQIDMIRRTGNLLLITLAFVIYTAIRRAGAFERSVAYFNGRSIRSRLVLLFLIAQFIFVIASAVIVLKGVELVGDEPHYLAISQSLAKDGDLNVFNQYARDEYREFINYRLAHHSKVGKGFKKWYSFHLPGLSVTIAPFFFLKISIPLLYFLIRVYLGLFGSLLGVVIYLISLKLWRRERLSFFIFFVFMFTAPVFFYSFHIFAELQALLLILLSIWFALFKDNGKGRDILIAGFLLGMTVFWGMKYLIFISVFALIYLVRKSLQKDLRSGLLFIVFPFIFVCLFFVYLYLAYGNLSPMSVYTGVLTESQRAVYSEGMAGITPGNRIETLFDYFFDQRDGLLLYSPFYLFFFPGLILALKHFRKYRLHLLISAASFIYLLYHGYSTVRPGYCPQARYLLPVIWTLMLFAVIYYIESRNALFKRLFVILPFYSFFIVLFQVFNPFTLYQSTTHNYLDRSALLFQKLGNIHIDFSSILPSFIKVDGNFSYLPNVIFLILFMIFIVLSMKRIELKWTFPFRIPVLVLLFVVFSLFPRVSMYNPVKVKTAGGLSFLVHGNPYPKSDILDEFVFRSRDSSTKTVTISTIKELKKIELYLSGHMKKGTVELINFDRPRQEIEVQKGVDRTERISGLRFRKRGLRFFYTLNFKFCYCLEEGIDIRITPF